MQTVKVTHILGDRGFIFFFRYLVLICCLLMNRQRVFVFLLNSVFFIFRQIDPCMKLPMSHLVLKNMHTKHADQIHLIDISTVTPRMCHPFGIKMVLEPSSLKSTLNNGRRLSGKKCQAKEKK